jgi:hypothetical protein
MGLFRKAATNNGSTAFWRTPPFRTDDPALLYHHGIRCVTQGDPVGMMQCGWSIWRLAGLHQHQARDFLYDGFTMWEQGEHRVRLASKHAYSLERGVSFIQDYFDSLMKRTPPPYPPDLYGVPPELVEPASTYYSARCFAGTKLLELADGGVDEALVEAYEPIVFRAITEAHPAFVPPRAMAVARTLASRQGLPDPFAV